jgi:histone H2B
MKPTHKLTERKDVFSLYIFRLLRSMHPNLGISKRAMSAMNSFVKDMFDRLVSEASKVSTLPSRLHHAIPGFL